MYACMHASYIYVNRRVYVYAYSYHIHTKKSINKYIYIYIYTYGSLWCARTYEHISKSCSRDNCVAFCLC